jgi:hypothetical protein
MKKILFISIFFFIFYNGNFIKKMPVIKNAKDLSKYEGEKVTVIGKLSDIQWQHKIKYFKSHPVVLYFDMDDIQIVIYSKEEINNKKTLKITGKVIKIIWDSEKAGDDNSFAEFHIILDKYEIAN